MLKVAIAIAEVESAPDRLAAFSEAVGVIYRARLDPSRMPEISRAIERLLEADEVEFVSASEEPCIDPMRARRPSLCLDVSGEHVPHGRIFVRRRLGRKDFTDEHVELLSLLRPHLQNAEWLASLMPHGAIGRLASDAFVSLMNKGLMVCEANGALHWGNPTAAAILASGEGLAICDGCVRASRAFETSNMLKLLQSAVRGKRGAMLISRGPGKHAFGIAVAPLSRGKDQGTLALIAIKEIERTLGAVADRLGEMLGLTPAEERLAVLLLNGHTLQSAAEACGKTLATVKTQLHTLLKKTGARGQTELISLLLSLPSLI